MNMSHQSVKRREAEPLEPRDADAEAGLLSDVRSLIDASRWQLARVVNSAMVLTYWSIGARIAREVMGD